MTDTLSAQSLTAPGDAGFLELDQEGPQTPVDYISFSLVQILGEGGGGE